MGAGSLLRTLRLAVPALAAVAAGLGRDGPADAADCAAWAAGSGGGGAARLLIEEDGSGLSTATKVMYILLSIVLVAVSGLMAGLVLGLLSLDKVDLEVAKRCGTEKQRWLVQRVEPFTHDPHWVMCALVVVNAACNTALPLFIDRLLNPLAAILISVTAVLIFAEIAPQAVCKRYGLEIGAYCSWLVRALMVLTAPVSWPLGKLLDWLLGEESALFRRQELKALVGLHAETQQDGSVGALTSDEVQVIQGALDMASKTAETVMTPLNKVFMLSSNAVINSQLLAAVIAAGHSRVPVYEGDNRQAILGLILVKELVLVDETAGVRVRDLRLREMPFLRADIPLYDVMKIFRFGRRHMACLTRVSSGEASASKGSQLRMSNLFRRPSPAFANLGDKQVEEIVGLITIEDVLEELLQAEIVDETDQYEDNLQTVHVPKQVSLKELPPNLRRFLSPRRSMHGFSLAAGSPTRSPEGLSRVSNASPASGDNSSHPSVTAAPLTSSGQPAVTVAPLPAASAAGAAEQVQQEGQQLGIAAGVSFGAPSRRAPSPSLGAAAAASALMLAGGPASTDAGTMVTALTAGVRAAELNSRGASTSSAGLSVATDVTSVSAPAPAPSPAAASPIGPRRPPLPRNHGGRASGDFGASRGAAGNPLPGSGSAHRIGGAGGGVDGGITGGTAAHVTLELGELRGTASSEGGEGEWSRDEEQQQRPLMKRGNTAS